MTDEAEILRRQVALYEQLLGAATREGARLAVLLEAAVAERDELRRSLPVDST